jgi:hypothetical protein
MTRKRKTRYPYGTLSGVSKGSLGNALTTDWRPLRIALPVAFADRFEGRAPYQRQPGKGQMLAAARDLERRWMDLT